MRGPEAVDRLLLRRYLSYLATRRYSRRTIARRASALRRYFGWLHRSGLVATDPSRGLSAPQGEGRLPTVLRRSDLETLLSPPAGDDEPVALRDQAVVELLYGSGLRVAELCGLRPDDLDLRRRLAVVWGKGSKQRQVPLSEPSAEAVAAWLVRGRPALATPASPADALFVNRRGRRLTPRDARRILDRRAASPTTVACARPPTRPVSRSPAASPARPAGVAGLPLGRSPRRCAHIPPGPNRARAAHPPAGSAGAPSFFSGA